MNSFKKHISFLLLLISFAFIVPQELLHELTCHEDTVDESCLLSDGISVGTQHHHCTSLQSYTEPFHSSEQTAEFTEITKITSPYTFGVYSIKFEKTEPFSNRGPPALVSFC
ncbi:MAG: hypothetical protein ABI723_20275 [Bacteroidia bacterium]